MSNDRTPPWWFDHTEWARAQMPNLDAPAALQERLRQLDRRLEDGVLRVAVFGEFSSGKSTLLNGLLGRFLLPSSALVTTTLVTHLFAESSWTGFELRLKSGEVVRSDDRSCAAWFADTLGEAMPDHPAVALHRLMSDPDASAEVAGLDLHHTDALLGRDVVLLDTPGFNATDEGHRELAENTADLADLVVVLIPATAIVSTALAEFVSEVLSNHEDRCVFVLTKGRLIGPGMDKVAADARRRLDAHGFTGPLLRCDAADVALHALDPTSEIPGANNVPDDWAIGEMTRLANELTKLAEEGREEFIAATTRALLGDVLSGIAEVSERRRTELENLRQAHDRLSITDLDDFLSDWTRTATTAVEVATRNAVDQASRKTPKRVNSAPKRILDSESSSTSDDVLEKIGSEIHRAATEWTRSRVNKAAEEVVDAIEKQQDLLTVSIDEQYRQLVELAGQRVRKPKVKVAITTPSVDPPTVSIDTVRERIQEIETPSAGEVAGTAGVLGVIGFFFGGPIGAGIGAAIGAAISGDTASKDQVEAAFQPVVKKSAADAQANVRKSKEALVKDSRKSVANVAAAYAKSYGPAVDELIVAENERRDQFQHEIDRASSIMREARDRQNRIGRESGV